MLLKLPELIINRFWFFQSNAFKYFSNSLEFVKTNKSSLPKAVSACALVIGSSFLLAIYDDSNNAFISENISYTTSTEWTRVEHTFTTPSGCTDVRLYTYRNTSGSTGTFFQWGCQSEEGSYATSYIPTSGSTVTRNQDIFTRDGIGSLINSTEGVLFIEFKTLTFWYL